MKSVLNILFYRIMITKEIKVTNILGIHARPASLIVKQALQFKSDINLIKNGVAVDAKSIMNVMMLAAEHQSKITIQAAGPDEKQALASICDLFEKNFNEE